MCDRLAQVMSRAALSQLRHCQLDGPLVFGALWMPLGSLDRAYRIEWAVPVLCTNACSLYAGYCRVGPTHSDCPPSISGVGWPVDCSRGAASRQSQARPPGRNTWQV